MSEKRREVYTPETAILEARINDIKTRIQMVAKENRYAAGFTVGLTRGFMLGLIISLTLFGVLFVYFI